MSITSECFGPTESQFTLVLNNIQTSEAITFCENIGQVMATAQNQQEFTFLQTFFDVNGQVENVKLGLQRTESVPLGSNIVNFASFDGTPGDFFVTPNLFPWDVNQPDNTSQDQGFNQNCVT